MSDTVEFWAGEFGTAYTARNRVDWRARIPFWDKIIQKTGARSVYEIGCNAGWNLSAIKHSIHGYGIHAIGEDINEKALEQAKRAGLNVGPVTPYEIENAIELVFTSGVLIHISPDHLKIEMGRIVKASCDYVLAVEYEAEEETEVEYRGHAGKLWKRNYGAIYESMGLNLVDRMELSKSDGFDDCTAWLLRK